MPTTKAAATAPAAPAPTTTLAWWDCGDLQCGVLQVPLDHTRPDGPTIGIDINRAPARSTDQRIGALLVNPGGPGGSGTSLARALATSAPDLAEVFDIVGWDPRGVGPSAELDCDEIVAAFYRLDNSPDTIDERAELDEAARLVSTGCVWAEIGLLPHIGTGAVVDDMDLIRQVLGEDQISFLGFSYGTMLGLVYAERYGPHLRAAVLDGILDPTFSLEEWLTSQAVATEASLASILTECANCGGIEGFAAIVDQADRGELMADDTQVGSSDVTRAGILATYSPRLHSRLAEAVTDAVDGDGRAMMAMSEGFLDLTSFDVYTAVSCLDNAHPDGFDAYDEFVQRITVVAPVLGPAIANELRMCARWGIPTDPPITEVSDASAPPMLLLGNTGDSATPYLDAVRVAERLDRAILVTYLGEGHTSYQEGSACVDDAVVAYLTQLVLPAADLVCN